MSGKERIGNLLAAIGARNQDPVLAARERAVIEKLIKTAAKYIEIVANQVILIQGGEADARTLADVDTARSRTHDSLIAQINIINRLCEKYGVPYVYEGDDDRRSKGDFALQLINEYFRDRP
ncbi:MAG TPA: DUF3232 domain-containing protein [Syntrophomonadaceae bacterium]|nr:DUF3232 domain-containing protein [Syntrophomonadaceae bacterium]